MLEFGLKPKTEAGVVPLQASKGFRDGVRFEPVMNFEATSWGNYVACTQANVLDSGGGTILDYRLSANDEYPETSI